MTDKTLLTTLDMRNAKYQGAVKLNAPQGLGFLLNLDLQLVFTSWNRQDIQGPTLIIYPNRNYLYGTIRNKKLEGIVTYFKSNGQSYHFNFVNGVSEKLAHDQNNGVITELIISQGKMSVGKSEKVKNNNKWQVISRILGVDVQPNFKGVKNFIKENYEKQQPQLFECSETSGLTYFGFKNTMSLGVKFDRNQQVCHVGTFEAFPQNIEFGRKYTQNPSKAIKIEQGRFTQPEKIFKYQKKRPIQAAKFTQQYFKCGTTFKDIFFKTPVLQDIQNYIKSIEKQISKLYMLQYGQRILERDKEEQQNYQNKEYSIQEVKKQIYAVVDRRNQGTKKTQKSFRQSRNTQPLRWSRQKQKQRQRLTPSKNIRELPRDVASEPRDLSSNKRNHKRYMYTNIVKDEMKASHSPYRDDRTQQRYYHHQQPKQFTLLHQSPAKRNAYFPSDSKRQEYQYMDSNRNYNNYKPRQQFTFKNRIEEPFFGRSPRPEPPRTKIIHQPSGQPFIHEPRSKYAYMPDSANSKKTKTNEPFAPNSAYHNQEDSSNIEHYIRYKNRNKTPTKDQRSNNVSIPRRYNIYENKRQIAEGGSRQEHREQRQNDPGRESPTVTMTELTPIRKKYFKYL